MKIYVAIGKDDVELAHPLASKGFETINQLCDGNSHSVPWAPLPFTLIQEDNGRQLRSVDTPWLGDHVLILKPRAVTELAHLLDGSGELLPLESPANLQLFNSTVMLDALNEDTSILQRFSSGQIMHIRKYDFREEVVAKADIFRIPNVRVSSLFFSEQFVEEYEAKKLTGLDFKTVWSSSRAAG